MASSRQQRIPDTTRVARWRAGLIEDLGPDLRQCLQWMHNADPTGLVIVLRSMRRLGVAELVQQGASLYWRQLTVEKRTGRPMPEGAI